MWKNYILIPPTLMVGIKIRENVPFPCCFQVNLPNQEANYLHFMPNQSTQDVHGSNKE